MSDLVKKIKIKKQDGTFTDYIPIGAEAQNIETNDGESVEVKLNKKPYYYNTVADMIADTKLKIGDMATTLGYYSVNDGGASEYKIINSSAQIDNGSVIELSNGLKAILIIKNGIVKVEQFNIFENQQDIRNNFQNLLNFIKNNSNITKVVFSPKTYYISNYCYIEDLTQNSLEIDFNGAELILTTPNLNAEKALIDIKFSWRNMNSFCTVKNGNFDGESIQPDFSPNFNPPNRGMPDVIRIEKAKICNIFNCHFTNWFFTNCIGVYYATEVNIQNCIGEKCGGRSAEGSGDYRGDGINITWLGEIPVYDSRGYERFYNENDITDEYWYDREHNVLYNSNDQSVSFQSYIKQDYSKCVDGFANVVNCSFIGYEPVDDPNPESTVIKNGCRSGRCGIDFAEFSRADTNKFLNIVNSKFYNYQRAIHYEEVRNVKIIATNSIFEEYGTGIIAQDLGTSDLTFNQCIFKRTLNIRGFTTDYDRLITGSLNNNGGKVTFNDCRIYDVKAGKISIYNENRPIYFNNCIFEVEYLNISTSEIYFNNCNIKANRNGWYKSVVSADNCNIELGYKHDENSNNIWGIPTSVISEKWTDENKIFYYNNCYFKNCNLFFNLKTEIKNSIFIYDNYCSPNNYDGTLYFNFCQSIPSLKFFNNTIYNNNSTAVMLMQPGRWSASEVDFNNNILYNIGIGFTNIDDVLTKKYYIRNNTFKNEAPHVNTACSTWDSKIWVYDNVFQGYTNNITVKTNLIYYNNYEITNEGNVILIS